MARCEPRSASVTRSNRAFSRTWNLARHSSRTAAPRRAASRAAPRYSVNVASVIVTESCLNRLRRSVLEALRRKRRGFAFSVIHLHPAIAVEPDLDVFPAVVELDGPAQAALDAYLR